MVAELKLESFTSGTSTGAFTGSHAVAYTLLCGMSGTQLIPVRVTDDGLLLTSGVN